MFALVCMMYYALISEFGFYKLLLLMLPLERLDENMRLTLTCRNSEQVVIHLDWITLSCYMSNVSM